MANAASLVWPRTSSGSQGRHAVGRCDKPAYRSVVGASTAGLVRDCRRRNASAAVMQVRPLSVSSGTAGWSRFGRSPFGPLGWL